MPRQGVRSEFSDLHRMYREESRKHDTAQSAKEIARSLVPSFLRCSKSSASKDEVCGDLDSRATSKYRRSASRPRPQEEQLSPNFDTKIPLGSPKSRRRQSVSGSSTLKTGFSEISSGGIGLMVNIFGESSNDDKNKRPKGHRRGISLTLHSHTHKPQWGESSDDERSGNESLESNKARVGRRTAPMESNIFLRRSQSGARRPRDTSLTSPIIAAATGDIKRSQHAASGHQASSASSTSARDSDKTYKRSSGSFEKASGQSSTRERRSSIGDKLSSARGKQKEMSSSGGKMSSKSPVPSLKKENAPPEIEIPPRYNTGTHVCYCCGKTRSKAYQSDHPIDVKIGAKPSLCGPCGYTIAVSGNLPGGLERKRAYLSGLHWCSTCGTLRSTKFHLNQQRHGPKSNLSEICGVYETLAEKEDTAPTARNSNRASQGDHDSPESAASCTSVDSPDPNYPSSDEEAPASRTLRPALRSILINTSTNDRDTGHSAGTAWVSKGASDSSSETRVHFTNPEISGLTEVPNYDRSPIELDYPEHASRPSPMIPSARRAQPAAEQPSTDSSSSPDSEPPHVLPRPVYKDGVPTGMGTTGSSTQDTATRGEVPKRGDTHHPEPSYRPVPAHNEQGNDRGSRWTTQEHNPMFDTSAPATDYRSSTEYLGSQTQGHHVKLPKDHPIQPLSGYCPSPPVEETISPLSGYCAPHVDDYCTTPSLDEPIHQQTSFPNSSTDTFGRPSPDITSEAPHLRSGNNHNSQTFAHPGPSQEEPVYDATFFAPSSTHSSQTLRPSTSREFSSQTLRPSTSRDFSTGPSPVFSSSSSRGPSPNTESSAGGGDHAFTSDAQRRAESEARMFAAAGYDMPMAEEAEMKEGSPSESKAWEVESEEAEEIEKEHIARMGGKYVNTSFQM